MWTARPRTPSKVIILPGGLVSPLAYAPLARTMAQKGYSSFVVRFDFDLGERHFPYIHYYILLDVHCDELRTLVHNRHHLQVIFCCCLWCVQLAAIRDWTTVQSDF